MQIATWPVRRWWIPAFALAIVAGSTTCSPPPAPPTKQSAPSTGPRSFLDGIPLDVKFEDGMLLVSPSNRVGPHVATILFHEARSIVAPTEWTPAGAGVISSEMATSRGDDDEVAYRQPWPGIDLIYSTSEGLLTTEVVVQTTGRVEDLSLRYSGVGDARLNEDGSLEMRTPTGHLVARPPQAFQKIEGLLQPLDARFVLRPANGSDPVQGLQLGSLHDPTISVIVIWKLAWHEA